MVIAFSHPNNFSTAPMRKVSLSICISFAYKMSCTFSEIKRFLTINYIFITKLKLNVELFIKLIKPNSLL